MNILIVNWRDVTHPWAGGAETHLHQLAKEWISLGHTITMLVGGYKGAIQRDNLEGINIIRIGGTYSIFFFAPLYYLLNLRNKAFDCIVEVSHGIPFFLLLFAKKQTLLVIHHNHRRLWQTEFPPIISQVGIFLEEKITPLIYRKTAVVTLSKSSRSELEKMGFKNVTAIPPGIDNDFYKSSANKPAEPLILYLGRLRKYKRIDLLLKIFPEIKKQLPKARLIIAGDGQDRVRLKHLAHEKGLDKEIVFKGSVSEEEKLKLLQEAWVLAFPTLMEGWGLVIMEAAACGTPVVAFKVPGVVDAVVSGETGLLVNNLADFTRALVDILKHKSLRERLSRAAARRAFSFSWKKSALNMLQAMSRVQKDKFHPVHSFRSWYIAAFLKPKNLLEAGCGTGILLEKLHQRGIKVQGMDINPEKISQIPGDLSGHCFVADITRIPRKNQSFDVVSCVDVLEHLERKDFFTAIKECARVAQRAIYFDITCLEDLLYIFADSTHVSKMFSWQWKKALKDALGKGWRVKRGPVLPFIHQAIFIAERIV